jgi:hypothetical protein
MSGFSQSSTIITTPYAYRNFLNKGNNPLRMQVPNCFSYLLVFVDANENFVMVDDVIMSLNPPVALVEKEELEEASLNVNVSQWLREKKPSRRVVHTRVDRSTWDCRLSPNPYALTIYLEFVPAHGATPERFEEC